MNNIKAKYIFLFTVLSLIKEIYLVLNQLESEVLKQTKEIDEEKQNEFFES